MSACVRAHCRPRQSSEFAGSGRSQKSKLWEPKGLNERAARRGRKERRNSEVVNFTCVCTGGRGRTRTAIERSFSHRESFSAVIFGSLSALASI